MKVLFKNGTQSFDCSEPIEQKIFKSGASVGWAIMFHITADVSSSEMDEIITPDGISELTFTNDAGTANVVTGYTAVSACTIRHKNAETIAELQFTKIGAPGTAEGDAVNG